MKEIHFKLIKVLITKQNHIKSTQLAHALNVSLRSVKNYVRDINILHPNLISSSKIGYAIDIPKAKDIVESHTSAIPQSSHERTNFIINILIKSSKPINVHDICDELYISLSTLRIDLNKIKKKIAEFDLKLVLQKEEIEILGKEKNKRKLFSSILYDMSNVNFISFKTMQEAFSDIDISFIKQTIVDTCNKHHYFVNDYALVNLILHVTISIDRIKNNNISYPAVAAPSDDECPTTNLAKEIVKKLEEKFDVMYSEGEIYELSLLILSRATTIDYKSLNVENLEKYIGSDCMVLVKKLIDVVSEYYYIDLTDPDFFVRFALHIRNLLIRCENNYLSKNPLAEGIKTTYPLIYDTAVLMASLITKHVNIEINDDEIAYIAFHIGSAFQTQITLSSKLSVVIYCPSYYDINSYITEKISEHFSHDVLVTHIVTDESELASLSTTDLVVATVPVNKVVLVPIAKVSLFVNESDLTTIRLQIKKIKMQKKKEAFRNNITTLIKPELFKVSDRQFDMYSCIHHLTSRLESMGYVDEKFEADVIERERMSSTSFSQVAIPHSMQMNAHKTGICTLISKKGVQWGENRVNLILLLFFNKADRALFNEVFDPITMILSDATNTSKLIESKNYEEFIDLIVSLYKE